MASVGPPFGSLPDDLHLCPCRTFEAEAADLDTAYLEVRAADVQGEEVARPPPPPSVYSSCASISTGALDLFVCAMECCPPFRAASLLQYPFALKNGDFRLNFALNCGSYSNPPSVPIYRAETLSSQLDEASRQYLKDAVSVSFSQLNGMTAVGFTREVSAGKNTGLANNRCGVLKTPAVRLAPHPDNPQGQDSHAAASQGAECRRTSCPPALRNPCGEAPSPPRRCYSPSNSPPTSPTESNALPPNLPLPTPPLSNHDDAHAVPMVQICQWYEKDFGTPLDCARAIAPFLPQEMQESLLALMDESSNLVKMMDEGWMLKEGNVTVKYTPYDFHCRPLKLAV